MGIFLLEQADLIIVGAGAAGMAAAIFAGEAAAGREIRILLLDGAKKLGAKILVSGGGRCNVTNRAVTAADYNGGPRTIIANVLKAFDERRTIEWMRSMGVELKLEPTGKYFPVTDKARTVLDALLRRIEEVGVEIRSETRVTGIERAEDYFIMRSGEAEFSAPRVIVATGGLALPKSGSDGRGLSMMERLGHTVVPTTPALVPLILKPGPEPGGRFAELAGLTMPARLALLGPKGEKLNETSGSMVFTHFGVSGPAPMDFSRHWLRARLDRPEASFQVRLATADFKTPEEADPWLQAQAKSNPKRAVATALSEIVPDPWARMLARDNAALGQMKREDRLRLARDLVMLPLDVVGDRGYAFAETTAGGIDLREIDPRTMASRKVPGLYLCGEILDVDGRIGGFSFQWAWASGYLAGRAAVDR